MCIGVQPKSRHLRYGAHSGIDDRKSTRFPYYSVSSTQSRNSSQSVTKIMAVYSLQDLPVLAASTEGRFSAKRTAEIPCAAWIPQPLSKSICQVRLLPTMKPGSDCGDPLHPLSANDECNCPAGKHWAGIQHIRVLLEVLTRLKFLPSR